VVSLDDGGYADVTGTADVQAMIDAVNATGKVASLGEDAKTTHLIVRGDAAPGSGLPRGLVRGSAFEIIGGRGVTCLWKGATLHVGNEKCIAEVGAVINAAGKALIEQAQSMGRTAVIVAVNGKVVGIAVVSDTVRPEARDVLTALREHGVQVYMCTGDHAKTAAAVGMQLGIPASQITADMLPDDKYTVVTRLKEAGRTVAMVGDGLNDSQALIAADLGIAIGAGAEIAIDSADIVLVRSKLWDVVMALRLARATYRKICWNFVWAFGYNIICVPLAAGVLYPIGGDPPWKIRLPPAASAATMACSSVLVVLSSLTLNFFKFEEPKETKMPPFSSL